ncbi:MAG: metallophosphoesterase [Sporomusaceae bacterium]|nr:metallophosphoesterase [Sporomusaceae bacterium]
MKVLIIADTHLKSPQKLDLLLAGHSDADALIHAGDFTDPAILQALQERMPLLAVAGNADAEPIRLALPPKRLITLAGYRIGIVHGHGQGKTTPDRALQTFAGEQVDIIIFGHSHQPAIYTRNKTLLLNPGSFTAKRQERWFSYIVLELDPTGISAKLICQPSAAN